MIDIFFDEIKELSNELKTLPGIVQLKPQGRVERYDAPDLFSQLVTDIELRSVVEKLFRDGHHARAVEESYKFIDNLVKEKSEAESGLTGSKLMTTVFSVGNPVLRINSGGTMSEEDEQRGYMQILSGCMTGIRNPRAHEHDWEDTETTALQLLSLANHLVERIRAAYKV